MLLAQADRLGVQVRWHQPSETTGMHAVYQAPPGRPGLLILHASQPPAANAAELCTLMAHEMVHVLQHWHSGFQAVLPLGWPTDGAAIRNTKLSLHEKEAFSAQNQPERVLQELKRLNPPNNGEH